MALSRNLPSLLKVTSFPPGSPHPLTGGQCWCLTPLPQFWTLRRAVSSLELPWMGLLRPSL